MQDDVDLFVEILFICFKTLFPFGLFGCWMSAWMVSESAQDPWMWQCTYCTDVYVGLYMFKSYLFT